MELSDLTVQPFEEVFALEPDAFSLGGKLALHMVQDDYNGANKEFENFYQLQEIICYLCFFPAVIEVEQANSKGIREDIDISSPFWKSPWYYSNFHYSWSAETSLPVAIGRNLKRKFFTKCFISLVRRTMKFSQRMALRATAF